MTHVEVHEGSVVDLVARIARERGLAEREDDRGQEGAEQPPEDIARSVESPPLLFPGAPRRGRRAR
jgi:hypothetical protein